MRLIFPIGLLDGPLHNLFSSLSDSTVTLHTPTPPQQIPLWLTVIILKAFDAKALMDGQRFWATVVLLELFGASITSFTYLTSFAFAKHSMAQVGTILLNFLFGLILVIVSIVMARSVSPCSTQHHTIQSYNHF